MRTYLILILSFFLLASCDKEGQLDYVTPEPYLPAYPGSFWDYTNGDRIVVDNHYHEHSYDTEVNSTEHTATVYVPYMDGKYVYGYSIYQDFPKYPLKQLLSESKGSWVVNEVDGHEILRNVISVTDSLSLSLKDDEAYVVKKFKNVITVVEYIDSLGVNSWYTKEYYGKNVGLLRVEVNNPYDTLSAIVEKDLLYYNIND